MYKNMYTISLKYFTKNEIFCLEIIQVQNLTSTRVYNTIYIKKTNLSSSLDSSSILITTNTLTTNYEYSNKQ